MFGRAASVLDRTTVISLAVLAGFLLLTGLLLAVSPAQGHSQQAGGGALAAHSRVQPHTTAGSHSGH